MTAKKRALSAAERGRLGGLARAKKLTKAQRQASGRKAGLANAHRLALLKALEDGLRAGRFVVNGGGV